MGLPINTLDKSQEADKVIQILKNLEAKASKASNLDNHNVVGFYYNAIRSGTVFNSLSDAGLTSDVLGPVIGAKLGIKWTDYETDYLSLKNTHLPAYVSFIILNQAEICAKQLGKNDIEYKAISDATKTQLTILLNNIKNMFTV